MSQSYFRELMNDIKNASICKELQSIERNVDWGRLDPYESDKVIDALNEKNDYFRGGPSPLGDPDKMSDYDLANFCHGSDDD